MSAYFVTSLFLAFLSWLDTQGGKPSALLNFTNPVKHWDEPKNLDFLAPALVFFSVYLPFPERHSCWVPFLHSIHCHWCCHAMLLHYFTWMLLKLALAMCFGHSLLSWWDLLVSPVGIYGSHLLPHIFQISLTPAIRPKAGKRSMSAKHQRIFYPSL